MRRLICGIGIASLALNIFVLTKLGVSDVARLTRRSSYPLLSQRIFVQDPNDVIINFTPLRTKLTTLTGRPRGFQAGVYFEYLPSGVSIGINEKTEFISASLLKLPFIMGVAKKVEQGMIDEDTILTLDQTDLDQRFGSLWKAGVGGQLLVRDAMQMALAQSDNTAVNVLNRQMDVDVNTLVLNALDIPIVLRATDAVVSAKNYASILRCLYLSCLLKYKNSQALLEYLSQSPFDNGIKAGVPKDVRVSHKIGIYDHANHDGGVRSDCGIVYAPKRPYILCVIVEGDKTQETAMTDFMKAVSAEIFAYVTSA